MTAYLLAVAQSVPPFLAVAAWFLVLMVAMVVAIWRDERRSR